MFVLPFLILRFKFLHICYIFPCFKCIRKVYLIVLNDLKNLIGKMFAYENCMTIESELVIEMYCTLL